MKITIIGCGHGGQALAADLSQKGCLVTLYASPHHPGGIKAIIENKNVRANGKINGIIPIYKATTSLEEAVCNSEYIFIVLPSFAHEEMFHELLPFLQSGQTIITLAANFASLSYLKLLEKSHKTIDLIDVASLPYVCRSDNNGNVDIISIKNSLALASIPAKAIDYHIKCLSPLFPSKIIRYDNALSLGMNITSGMTHPAITLLNAGRIGPGKSDFYFYKDGITPEIAHLIEKLDQERLAVGEQFGLKMQPYLHLMNEYYGLHYDSIYQFFRESPAHNALPLCPKSMQERYITQDVAGLLVAWYCLGQVADCDIPVMENLIHLAGLINNTNYLRTGCNLEKLNLQNRSMKEILTYVALGKIPQHRNGRYYGHVA